MSSFAASLEFCVCLHGSQHSSQAQSRHHSLRLFRSVFPAFGAHHAPVTEPATAFAHGRLRASHAVCLGYSTLEPAICARKEEADTESVSTTGRLLAESLVMRSDFFDTQTVSFGFYATSRHCFPRRSPRNSNRNATANHALQRTAPAVTVAAILARTSLVRSWLGSTSVAPFFAPPSQLPRQPPRSLSLESFGVRARPSFQ